jgi:hypothetical protein
MLKKLYTKKVQKALSLIKAQEITNGKVIL